jgi:hypothetical protein
MAKKATSKSTRAQGDAQPPDTSKPTMLVQLVRVIATLPVHRFISLNDAFSLAKSRLGSGDLAAIDLTQHAKAGHLMIAAWNIRHDGTEQFLILRSRFWQYFGIERSLNFFEACGDAASVRGSSALPGRWYFFADRRQLDQFYSATSPQRGKRAATVAFPPQASTASQDETDDETEGKIRPKKWLEKKLPKMKKAGKIPDGIGKTDFAKMLIEEMEEACNSDSKLSLRLNIPTKRHLVNELSHWGFWPISKIKIGSDS